MSRIFELFFSERMKHSRTTALLCLWGAVSIWAGLPGSFFAQDTRTSETLAAVFSRDQFKRYHQETLRKILAGEAESVRDFLTERLREHPQETESRFMLALAHSQLQEFDPAIDQVTRALEDGFPPGRFIAGPRELITPLYRHPEFRKLLDRFKTVPVHGPLLGHVSDRSVRVWLRTAQESDIRLEVTEANGRSEEASSAGRTSAQDDFTATLEVTGLQPARRYRYRVWIDGEEGAAAEFRTRGRTGEPLKFRFAFGGGAGFVPENERVWSTIGQFRPDALILLGDNVYIDDPTTPAMQKYTYYRRQSRPEWSKLTAVTPVYSIWDDHDFATNDSSGGPEIDEPEWKIPVWKIFRQNWANPAYGGGRSQPGCWYDFRVGDLHFILLDGRYYRHLPGGTMLGPAQKDWLKRTLNDSEATFKILASPVPWAEDTKPSSRDTWDGFPEEREEIFRFIEDNQIQGVALISADRHRSDAYRIERPRRPGSYDLYEFNSSRLTNQHVHPTMEHALFSYNEKQSFGVVDVDTTAEDPRIRYTVVSIDGEEIDSVTIKHSQLQ